MQSVAPPLFDYALLIRERLFARRNFTRARSDGFQCARRRWRRTAGGEVERRI